MDKNTRKRVKEHINKVMKKVIKRRVEDEPFRLEDIKRKNPFGYSLVPEEVWKGSKFERSFVTTLGQGVFEQIAKYIAEGSGAEAKNQYTREIKLNTFRIQTIEQILEDQRKTKRKKGEIKEIPLVREELERLKSLNNKSFEEKTVLFDLYVKRDSGQEEFYSFKTVKPNLDQTEKAKKDMLLLMSADENTKAYFGLPYNPAGEGCSYRESFSVPYKLFDMDNDPNVLIGSELWNKIGQDDNTYNELIDIFEEVGKNFSQKEIEVKYFG